MTEIIEKEFVKELSDMEYVDDEKTITAYLTTFENSDVVGDVIKTGALDDFVEKFDPEKQKLPMLYGHDTKSIIGEWVKLEIDEYGVKGTGVLYTETSLGDDVYKLLKRKAVASVSIGFSSSDYDVEEDGSRTFKTIVLRETSVVLNPANPQAKILSVKSADGMIETKALKSVLKEAGLTNREAEALFLHGWKGLKNMRQADDDAESLINILKEFKLGE